MKKSLTYITFFGLAGLLLVGTGCRRTSSTLADAYTMQITASPVNTEVKRESLREKQLPVTDLMKKLNVPVETSMRGDEVITSLKNIITTASNGWNLYINNQKQSFHQLSDIVVSPADAIEWRYESISTAK